MLAWLQCQNKNFPVLFFPVIKDKEEGSTSLELSHARLGLPRDIVSHSFLPN